MRARPTLVAVLTIFLAGGMGFLTVTGRLATVPAEDSQAGSGGTVLSKPEQPFKGKIGRSTRDFPKEVAAPNGAPNVLLIMTDDTGFDAPSNFGGPIGA
jgi:hypothetical protein